MVTLPTRFSAVRRILGMLPIFCRQHAPPHRPGPSVGPSLRSAPLCLCRRFARIAGIAQNLTPVASGAYGVHRICPRP